MKTKMMNKMNKYILVFIFQILCLLILLTNWNCVSILQASGYEFVDRYNNVHLYEEKIKRLNKTATHYCQKHYVWETIKSRYTKNGIIYLVTMDKGELK